MGSCAILLKPNFVHINIMKSGYKKICYEDVISAFIAVAIFQEIWPNDVSASQAAPTTLPFVMRALGSVRARMDFPSSKCANFSY